MSKTVDHRIVEMRFDNKQFEAGAKETMSTLGKLKEALKLPNTGKALEGIDKATKGIKLDGIAAGVEALERRFSELGIVGMRVIENTTDGLMNKLHAAVSFVTDSIVSGGIKRAMNIENAHFQLQALLKDETKVQAVMADAMESVDGTAYAYDEAAKAASQFAASGIQAGDEMLNALKGITGVAEMTNSSFEDISTVFTTVAGNGRLMGDQLLQLSSRGLNAASTLADYFREVRGQTNMTEADIREMVSKGKISFKDFSDAMTWAFGDSAKRANETFTGSMSNMKSALARIGAGFISPLVEQNGEMVQLFNALRIKIDDVKSALVFDEQRSAISGLAEVTKMSNDELSEMFKTIKTNGKVSISDLDTLTKKGANATDALTKYINGVTDGSIRASYAITSSLEELTNGTKVSTADIRRFVEEGKIDLATFTSAMETEFGTEMTLSKQFTDGFLNMISKVVDAINKADMTKPMEVFYYWVESIKNIAKGIGSVVSPIGKAFNETFSFINIDKITSLSEAVTNLTSKMRLSESGGKNLHDAFKGVFDIAALLGDGFIKLLNAILPISKPIGTMNGSFLELIGSLGRTLSEFSVWVRNSENVSKAFDKVHSGVDKMATALSNGIIKIKDFVKIVKDSPIVQNVISAASKALEELGNLGGKIEIRLIPFTKVLDVVLNIIKNVGPIAMTILKGIGNAISFLLDSISKALGTGGFNSWIDLFNTGMFVGILTGISKFIENISVTVSKGGGMFSEVNRILFQVKNTLLTFQAQLKADILKKIAVSVAILAASLFVLSMIDSEKLTSSLGAVTVLMGELFATMTGFEKIIKGSKANMINISAGLIGLSLSVLILAGALKKISDIDSDKMLGSLGAISVLLVEMTGVAIILSKYGGKVKTGVVGIIAFSAAIYILTSSVKKLGELDTDTLIKGLASVGALLAELALFMMSSKIGSLKPTQAVGIVILSAALLILQKAVEGFGNLNPEVLLTGLIAIGAVLTEIAAFSLAAGESKHILKTTASLVIMVKAIEMLQKPMSDFGNMEWSQIGKGLVAMGGALGEITLAMRLMPKNALTIGVGLLAVAGSLTIIGKVVMDMSGMSWEEIGRGMVTLGGSLAILALAMNAMKGTLGASAAMLIMASSLAILTPVLKSLGSMSWIEIGKGLVVLAGAFAVIGVAASLLSPVIPAILGLSGAITLLGIAALAVGAGIFALSVGLTILAASGVAGAAALVQVVKILIVGVLDTIAYSASAIGRVLKTLILTACDVIITCVPEIVKTILVVVKEVLTALANNAPEIVSQLLKLIIGVIDALAADLPTVIQSVMNLFSKFFAGIIQALNGMDTDVLVQTIAGVGLLAGIMLAMAALSNLAPSAMVGVLAFGAIVAELAIVLAAVGALAQIPGLKWLIDEGGDLLEGVGTAIGKFIGGIIGGVLGGISSQLPQIGSDLSQFMINLVPFIIGSKMIDAESLACVGFLAAIILALTAAEVINGIASLFGLSLVDMAVELSAFMVALTPFIIGSKQLSAESMEACGYLAGMILKLTAANVISGIANFFGLSGSISDFGKELSAFGPHIKQFAEDVKDVKPEAVQGAAAAAEIMAEVAKKLPGTDGLVQKIFGEKSLAEFGKELVDFGPAIKEFGETVKDVKPEAVEGAAAAAEIMANLADKLPAQDGLLQKIMGEKSLSEFGEELVAFGPLIKQFSDEVAGINPESVSGVASITEIMSTLANNLPSSDTLWNKLFGGGKKSISEFGTELVGFGDSMSLFSQSISGVNSTAINSAIKAFKSLVDLSNYVGGAGSSNITNFANGLTKCVDNFVAAFTNATSKVTTGINTMITATLTAITNKNAEFLTKGTASANQYLTGIKNQYPVATTTGTEIANKPLLAMQLKVAEFLTKGTASANQFLQGFKNKYGEATTTGKTLANNALAGCQSLYSSFYTAGANGGQGFVDGLKSKMSAATEAGAAIGKAAYDAAKKALDEHSPSKKMGEVGENAGLGFINKLMLYVSKAALAGKEIGKAAIDGTRNGLEMLDDIGDLVLHPSVDMDEIYSSVKEIEDLFNNAISGIRANAISVNTQVQKSKNGSSENVQDQNKPVSGGVTNYNFNQYNTSPKALSRIEIYRQTNNQFRQFKEVTNPT